MVVIPTSEAWREELPTKYGIATDRMVEDINPCSDLHLSPRAPHLPGAKPSLDSRALRDKRRISLEYSISVSSGTAQEEEGGSLFLHECDGTKSKMLL
ncbi:hypothetical protein FVEN_g3438 [Fusarium venenatum]|nr:hypothetical protein FVEN_g3438 [Fusarium venenatum]